MTLLCCLVRKKRFNGSQIDKLASPSLYLAANFYTAKMQSGHEQIEDVRDLGGWCSEHWLCKTLRNKDSCLENCYVSAVVSDPCGMRTLGLFGNANGPRPL